MSNLGGRCGSLPAADAFQPVAMLVIALIEMNFPGPDHALQNLRVARHQRLQSLRLAARIAGGAGRAALCAGPDERAAGAGGHSLHSAGDRPEPGDRAVL